MADVGEQSTLNDLLGSDSDGDTPAAKKDELDELLGGDDNSDQENPDSNKNDKKNDELNDLLGASDDDEDEYAPSKPNDQKAIDEVFPKAESQEENKFDDLEQILGKVEVKSTSKSQKLKTKSKLIMPTSYRVPSANNTLFVRTPNFIKIQPAEYDEPIYDAETERSLFDGSTAVVRWRIKRDINGEIVNDSNGKPLLESNARVLHWADGSVQLVVGDAVFQCKSVDVDNW